MRLNTLFRLLGTVLYGFIGWEIGITLVGTTELNTSTWQIIIPATLIGAIFGFVLAPWLVIAPARAARNGLRQVPINDLLAATIGLAIGLLIAALLSYPLSRLPPPFGGVLPLVMVILFGYLGAAVFVTRQGDVLALVQRRGAAGTTPTAAPSAAPAPSEPTLLLDTSVIIDGRIADIAHTGFLLGRLAVPRFVLNELQYIADSADSMRRNRGRRGLEALDRLQNEIDVTRAAPSSLPMTTTSSASPGSRGCASSTLTNWPTPSSQSICQEKRFR